MGLTLYNTRQQFNITVGRSHIVSCNNQHVCVGPNKSNGRSQAPCDIMINYRHFENSQTSFTHERFKFRNCRWSVPQHVYNNDINFKKAEKSFLKKSAVAKTRITKRFWCLKVEAPEKKNVRKWSLQTLQNYLRYFFRLVAKITYYFGSLWVQ